MEQLDIKQHWEHIYNTKTLQEVSWYQSKPETSLKLIEQYQLPFSARIIDIGGGDSYLADYLLQAGYENITVLDISEAAIERAKARLGADAMRVNWIVTDITAFKPQQEYDCWHDRAAFHFLTDNTSIDTYTRIVEQAVVPGGLLIMATFSEQGPLKCSGIPIQQYSITSLTDQFKAGFTPLECFTIDHTTPFQTSQNFVFCSFKRTAG